MENKTWHSIPKETKESWGQGPWVSEPDKVQWLDEASGLPCLIVRGPMGALCGYVGVPEEHPFFAKNYSDCARVDAKPAGTETETYKQMRDGFDASIPGNPEVPAVKFPKMPKSMLNRMATRLVCGTESYCAHTPESMCEVHGGLTFSDTCRKPTRGAWEKWREYMLQSKHEIKRFPKGDTAQRWKEKGHLVDDFDAWVEHSIATSICHFLEKKVDEAPVWWLGFDCSHYMDISPKMDSALKDLKGGSSFLGDSSREYRDIAYVTKEVTALAGQLSKIDRLAVENAKRD